MLKLKCLQNLPHHPQLNFLFRYQICHFCLLPYNIIMVVKVTMYENADSRNLLDIAKICYLFVKFKMFP